MGQLHELVINRKNKLKDADMTPQLEEMARKYLADFFKSSPASYADSLWRFVDALAVRQERERVKLTLPQLRSVLNAIREAEIKRKRALYKTSTKSF